MIWAKHIGSQDRRVNEINNKLKELDMEAIEEANNRKKYYEDLKNTRTPDDELEGYRNEEEKEEEEEENEEDDEEEVEEGDDDEDEVEDEDGAEGSHAFMIEEGEKEALQN